MEIELRMNPARVCFGLSRIGYTPATAICDIIDNSITAKATEIFIKIIKENISFNDNRINNTKEYIIIDNGKGMTEEEIINALNLGSSSENYEEDTLSKFGLGLKSASLSQGNILDITSTTDGEIINRFVLNMQNIKEKYFCIKETPLEEDIQLLKKYKHGTVIRIKDIHKNNHPSIKSTIHELEEKLGVIYYYFLKENNLKIVLRDKEIEGIDILFSEGLNENLDEQVWDGKSVGWIYKPQEFILESSNNNKVTLEVTQLPYPPIFEIDGDYSQNEVREIYKINSKNYGVYVYRNKRLISWAEDFGGIIPNAQNLYSFRGRLNISSDSDDMFNIDVKKSNINLSEEAQKRLDDILDDLKRKSRKAWNKMTKVYKERKNEDPNKAANDIIKGLDDTDPLSEYEAPTGEHEEEKAKREAEINEEKKEEDISKEFVEEERNQGNNENDETTNQDKEESDRNHIINNKKIKHVDFIEDNLLFDNYFDAEEGQCIKINKNHRFAKLIYGDNSENTDMQIIIELFYYHLMKAEIATQTNFQKYDRRVIKEIIDTYKRALSNGLTNMCRESTNLPPTTTDND